MERVCPYCGTSFDQAAVAGGPESLACPSCGQELDRHQAPPEPGPPAAAPAPPPGDLTEAVPAPDQDDDRIPWEGPSGFWAGLVRTTGQVLFRPSRAFGHPARPGMGWALTYALILGTLGTCASLAVGNAPMPTGYLALIMIFSPLLVLAGVFVGTWILHACLMMLGGAKKGLETTLRVVGYSQAVGIFYFIPLVGTLLGFVWQLVAVTTGISLGHGISKGKAFFALILPIVVLLFVVVALITWFVSRGLSSSALRFLYGM